MRTREQILADCEAAFLDLQEAAEAKKAKEEEAAKDPRNVYSCRTCRFAKWDGSSLEEWHCREPLVMGFGPPVPIGSWSSSILTYEPYRHTDKRKPSAHEVYWCIPRLCGPEKALWQPKLTLCQRIIQFLTGDPA